MPSPAYPREKSSLSAEDFSGCRNAVAGVQFRLRLPSGEALRSLLHPPLIGRRFNNAASRETVAGILGQHSRTSCPKHRFWRGKAAPGVRFFQASASGRVGTPEGHRPAVSEYFGIASWRILVSLSLGSKGNLAGLLVLMETTPLGPPRCPRFARRDGSKRLGPQISAFDASMDLDVELGKKPIAASPASSVGRYPATLSWSHAL